MIVVDCSAVVDYLLERRHGPWVEERLRDDGDVHGPHLLDVEVVNVLRNLELRGFLPTADALRALDDYVEFDVARYSHLPLLGRIWALRAHVTAYDAAYIALSELLDAPLVTTDARLARTHGHRAQIVAP